MWTLVKREWEDNAQTLLIGFGALIALGVVALIVNVRAYDLGNVERLGLPKSLEGLFYTGILIFSLIVTGLGSNQIARDRTRKTSAFLVTLATTRQQIFLTKIFAGVIFTFVGIILSAMPTMIFLKMRPPLLPVDYPFLLIRVIFAFCFVLTAYLLGLATGFSKGHWGLIFLPIILLGLLVAMVMVFNRFSSPEPVLLVLILIGLAFLIYARQKFLRASL